MGTLSMSVVLRKVVNGKDGKGISSTVVEYAIGDSGTAAPTSGWQTSVPSKIAGKYIWTRTVITYTSGSPTTSYTVSYCPNDGTSISIKGKAVAHGTTKANATGQVSSPTAGDYVIFDNTSGSAGLACYTGALWGTLATGVSDGDGYIVDGVLWMASGSVWTNCGTIQGPQGEQGEKGDSAFSVISTPNTLEIDTDADTGEAVFTNGNLFSLSAKYGTDTAVITSVNVKSISNCTLASVSTSGVRLAKITAKTITTKDGNGNDASRTVCATSGSVTVVVAVQNTDGTKTASFDVTLPFTVNVNATFTQMYADQTTVVNSVTNLKSTTEGLQTSVNSITTDVSGIRLKVSQGYTVGKNMLPKSRLRQIIRSGVRTFTVQLTAGKTYTLSGKGMINSSLSGEGLRLVVFAYRVDTSGKWQEAKYIAFENYDKWVEDNTSFTPEVGGLWYVWAGVCKVGVYTVPTNADSLAFIDWLHLEEGDVSTAPSCHEGDLEPQNSLVTEWDLNSLNEGTITTEKADGKQGTVVHQDDTNEDGGYNDLVVNTTPFYPEANTPYTLTFWAKGSGSIGSYLCASACYGSMDANGNVQNQDARQQDGYFRNTLTGSWTKYQVTFSTLDTLDGATAKDVIAVRLFAGGEVWCYGFKIEKGGVATDGMTSNDLLATGIDIESQKITVTANNFDVQNNAGESTMSVDKDGNLQTSSVAAQSSLSVLQRVVIKDGEILIYGSDGKVDIRIGTTSDGTGEIQFFDDEGKNIYSLGPDTSNVVNNGSKIVALPYVRLNLENSSNGFSFNRSGDYNISGLSVGQKLNFNASNFYGANSITANKWTTLEWLLDNLETLEIGTIDGTVSNYAAVAALFLRNTAYATEEVYRYIAKRVDNGYVADTEHNLAAEDAEYWDGKWFSATDYADSSTWSELNGLFMRNSADELDYLSQYNAGVEERYYVKTFYYVAGGEATAFTRKCSEATYKSINKIS